MEENKELLQEEIIINPKKENIFKKLEKSKKLQVRVFAISMLVLFVVYLPSMYFVEKNVVEKKIHERSVQSDRSIFAQVDAVTMEAGKVFLKGWTLKLDANVISVKVILKSTNGEEGKIYRAKQNKSAVVEEYLKYLEVDASVLGTGYSVELDEEDILQKDCYEVLLDLTYEKEKETERGTEYITETKKVSCDQYLFEGMLYSYNPKTTDVPSPTNEGLKEIVEKGDLCGYGQHSSAWVYLYNNSLYWLLDSDSEENKKDDLYIFLHLSTSNVSKLPEDRVQYGFDNRDFYFKSKEIFLEGEDKYRVAKVELDMDYPVTFIETGEYIANEGNPWRCGFMRNFSGR